MHSRFPLSAQRMALHINVMLKIHTALKEPLRQGGSVWVDADQEGISAFLVNGGRVLEARLTRGEWWLPDHPARGRRVADDLAADLEEQWRTGRT